MLDAAPALALEAYGWDPATVSYGSGQSRPWLCSYPGCGYLWEAKVDNRVTKGRGCPACAGKVARPGLNDLATLFTQLSKEAHGWDPKTVTPGSSTRRQWMCSVPNCGHIWSTSVSNRSRLGHGCPACSGRVARAGVNSLLVVNPEVAAEAHGWDPDLILPGSNVKYSWKCSDCEHIWATTSSARTSAGQGCPACSGRVPRPGVYSLATENPAVAAEAHGWDPDLVSPSSSRRLSWKCGTCAHIWETTPQSRNGGTGCQHCAKNGFDGVKPAYLYLLWREERDSLPSLLKIGITNTPRTRFATHRQNGWRILDSELFDLGSDARAVEKEWFRYLDSRGISRGSNLTSEPFDGYTECWSQGDLNVDSLSAAKRLLARIAVSRRQ